MNNLRFLQEKRNSLLDELDNIILKADNEKRDFSEADQARWEEAKRQIQSIDKKMEVINIDREEGFDKSQIRSATGNNDTTYTDRENIDNSNIRALKDVVLDGEKLEKREYIEEHRNLDLGNLVKAMNGKGDYNSKEAKYYRAMQSSGNKVTIPQQLSDRIIDFARNNSSVFGKIPTIQMPSNNLRVAKQVSDVQANFVKEGELIPIGEATFQAIDLEGKTLALFVPISEQLLDSAANLSSQLIQSCARAIAVALDKALLYGDGVTGDSDNGHKIKGLMTYSGINTVEYKVLGAGINYDPILKAIAPIKKANLQATDVALSTDVGLSLAGYKTADGLYIDGPKVLNNYEITESNNINDEHILAYDRNQLLLGIHKDMTIEIGTSGDMFQRIQKGIRIYLRTDLGVINEKAITKVTLKNQSKENQSKENQSE